MVSIRYRLHEWLADRLSWVQYPRQEYLSRDAMPKRRLFQFKYQMPWWERLVLIQLGLLVLFVGAALLVVGLFFGYVLLKAIF